MDNEKWSNLIYRNIKIGNIDVGGKTRQEAKNIIKSKYIDEILRGKLYVTADNKVYSINNSILIKHYDLDNVIEDALQYGKNLSIIEKHLLVKIGSKKSYSLDFTCNDNILKEFTKKIEKRINRKSSRCMHQILP